jgi:hypothetical protein
MNGNAVTIEYRRDLVVYATRRAWPVVNMVNDLLKALASSGTRDFRKTRSVSRSVSAPIVTSIAFR